MINIKINIYDPFFDSTFKCKIMQQNMDFATSYSIRRPKSSKKFFDDIHDFLDKLPTKCKLHFINDSDIHKYGIYDSHIKTKCGDRKKCFVDNFSDTNFDGFLEKIKNIVNETQNYVTESQFILHNCKSSICEIISVFLILFFDVLFISTYIYHMFQ